jgi:Uma2 family endonuclease
MYQAKTVSFGPREQLPTMYDLPSEEIGDAGLPDQYHLWQAELLAQTFLPPNYPREKVFVGCDLNLYYTLEQPRWYKRPDWFGAVGVDRFYGQKDSRLSYVIWQEQVRPLIVIEFLSPSTEKEDLGRVKSKKGEKPSKWQVYEEILQIPYYVVFNGHNNEFKLFKLEGGKYAQVETKDDRYWFKEIKLGLGLYLGNYQGLTRLWLRWYDENNNLIPTPVEQEAQRAEQEAQRANSAELEIAKLKQLLQQAGVEMPEFD